MIFFTFGFGWDFTNKQDDARLCGLQVLLPVIKSATKLTGLLRVVPPLNLIAELLTQLLLY